MRVAIPYDDGLGIRVHYIAASEAAAPRVRSVPGVVHADALFGSPDIIAIVAGDDIKLMDEVIDGIAVLSDVEGTDTKVARWLDGVGPPSPYTPAA